MAIGTAARAKPGPISPDLHMARLKVQDSACDCVVAMPLNC